MRDAMLGPLLRCVAFNDATPRCEIVAWPHVTAFSGGLPGLTPSWRTFRVIARALHPLQSSGDGA
jgi:hypothetical protein